MDALQKSEGRDDESHKPAAADKLVHEYEDLRRELVQSQQVRFLTLGISFTITAAIAGLAFGRASGSPPVNPREQLVAGLAVVGLLLLCAALHLSTVLTQRIDLLSQYIQKNLEEPLGFGWETDWSAYRNRVGRRQWRPVARRFLPPKPLGTSKALASNYLVLVTVDVGLYAVAPDKHSATGWVGVSLLALLAIYLAINLILRFGWMLGWTGLYEQPARQWTFKPKREPIPESAMPRRRGGRS